MKKLTISCSLLVSCLLATHALANHRTGDFPLPELIVAGDFNQDGKIDLAINIAGFDNVALLQGDGQGGFTLKSHLETDTLPKGLAIGDMNKDNHLDLVSLSDWGYTIRINLGDGRGAFALATESNGDGDPTRLLLGDVNNDGNLDTIANAPSEGKIIIYLGDGKGGLSNSPIEIEGLRDDFALTTGDVNNDGNLDIIGSRFINSTSPSQALVFLGDGAGGFRQSADLNTDTAAVTLKIADMNNDGNPDLIVAGAGPENSTGNFISIFLGDGAGGFTLAQTTNLGPGSLGGDVGVGDFNEDGKLDVAFPVDTTQSPDPSTTVLLFFGDGSGQLNPGPSLTVGVEPHSVLALDYNKDGHVDLAVTNRTDATLSVLLGDGHGGFVTHAVVPLVVTPTP